MNDTETAQSNGQPSAIEEAPKHSPPKDDVKVDQTEEKEKEPEKEGIEVAGLAELNLAQRVFQEHNFPTWQEKFTAGEFQRRILITMQEKA